MDFLQFLTDLFAALGNVRAVGDLAAIAVASGLLVEGFKALWVNLISRNVIPPTKPPNLITIAVAITLNIGLTFLMVFWQGFPVGPNAWNVVLLGLTAASANVLGFDTLQAFNKLRGGLKR